MLSLSTSRKPPRWLLVAAVILIALVATVSLLESAVPDAGALETPEATSAPSTVAEPASAIPSVVPTWRLLVAMAIVVGIALGAAVVVKRFSPLGRTLTGGKKRIQVIEVHPLGGKRFLCLVRVDAHDLLLGLSPARIDLLTESPGADAADEPSANFAELTRGSELRDGRR